MVFADGLVLYVREKTAWKILILTSYDEKVALAMLQKKRHQIPVKIFLFKTSANYDVFFKLNRICCRGLFNETFFYHEVCSIILSFQDKYGLFGVSDVTILLVTWQSTKTWTKNLSVNHAKCYKKILASTKLW